MTLRSFKINHRWSRPKPKQPQRHSINSKQMGILKSRPAKPSLTVCSQCSKRNHGCAIWRECVKLRPRWFPIQIRCSWKDILGLIRRAERWWWNFPLHWWIIERGRTERRGVMRFTLVWRGRCICWADSGCDLCFWWN